jgi:hypothetical protein
MEKVANLIEKVDLIMQQPTITASQAAPPSSSQSIQHEASLEKTPPPLSCVEINVEPSSPSQNDSRTVQRRQRQRQQHQRERRNIIKNTLSIVL